MLKPEARATLLTLLASCLMLMACNDSAPEPTAKTPANTPSKAPKASGVGADMVAAVAPETSSAVIGVHFALASAPVINQGLPINVVVVPHREFTSVGVHFFGQDGLTMVSGDSLG